MIKIIIDAGHGGEDSGAISNGINEKDLNLQISDKVKQLLKGNGFEVEMTRTIDKYLALGHRVTKANFFGADLFLSIHCNAYSNADAEGFESIYYPTSLEGKIISDLIFDHVTKSTMRNHRSSRKDTRNLYVLRKTKMPAVIVECGFITNPFDAHLLKQNGYQWLIADGIVRGILKWRYQNELVKGN